jgi:hypothetical protein
MNGYVQHKSFIHLIHPLRPELTLCGSRFDALDNKDTFVWTPTVSKVVDCEECCEIILNCRKVNFNLTRTKS